MTDEKIIQLAEKHFSFIAEYTASGWIADTEDLLKFARELYNEGYVNGYNKGYDIGTLDMEDENV
jgi:hypothetical protein